MGSFFGLCGRKLPTGVEKPLAVVERHRGYLSD